MAGRALRRRLTRIAVCACACTALAASAAVTGGCTASTPSPARPPGGAGLPSAASHGSVEADAVALAAVTAWLSYDTRLDRRPNDTARRLASGYLGPSMKGQVNGFSAAAAPGAQWDDWTRRHARATVAARLGHDDHPADTPVTAYRQVVAAVTLRGDDGWSLVLRQTLYVELGRAADGGWVVTDVRAGEVGQEPQANDA